MRVTRAAEDPSIAFSPRPNFPRPRGTTQNRAVREMAKPARRLNLVALPTPGRPSGALTPRVASTRFATPELMPAFCEDTIGVDARDYAGIDSFQLGIQTATTSNKPPHNGLTDHRRNHPAKLSSFDWVDFDGIIVSHPGGIAQSLGSGTLSDKLGNPIRPVSAFSNRPYVVPRKFAADFKTEEETQLWHLKRAMGSLRCFELQWGLVRAELEAAMAKHKKGAKIRLTEGALAARNVQKHLRGLKDSKMVFETQARSTRSGDSVGSMLHDLHENRAAFVERVSQLKASVMVALDEIQGVAIEPSQGPKNMEKLIQYMHQALDILNAMDAMVSQEGFVMKSLKKSDLLNALGKLGRSAAAPNRSGLTQGGENALLKGGARKTVRSGARAEKDAGKERPGGG